MRFRNNANQEHARAWKPPSAVFKPGLEGRHWSNALFTGLSVLVFCTVAAADVLTTKNGERFVGRVVEERSDAVVFESESAGRITVSRAQMRELQRTPSVTAPARSIANTNVAAATSTNWWPPTLPADDRFDWIQLKSGEWLKGRLIAVEKQNLEFDSDELNEQTFDWEDVRYVRAPRSIDLRLTDGEILSGPLLVNPQEITVLGKEPHTFARDELVSLSPTGRRELDLWSGKVALGLTFRAGNVRQVDYTASASLKRRTALTRFSLDYLGSFSQVDETETANNQRVNAEFDIWLTRRLFLVTPLAQYFRDPFQNIANQATLGVGLGYDIIQSRKVEWNLTAGPAYQYTWFQTHQAGEAASEGSAAIYFGSKLDWELTRKVDLIMQYQGIYTKPEVGRTTHHGVITVETEITKLLDFDVSLIWDRVSQPVGDPGAGAPNPDDFRLVLSLGLDL